MNQTALLGPARLIGRAPELFALQGHLTAAATGAGRAVLLRAPVGMGKSRLLAETLARARAGGVQPFVGRAFALEADFPYAVIAGAFQGYLRANPERSAALVGEVPELATLFPLPGVGRPAAPASKMLLFEGFLTFLGRLAADEPVLVVLDDIHWADAASLELIHYAAHNLEGQRVMLLMACRSEEETENDALQGVVASLSPAGRLPVLELPPLSLSEVAEMTCQLLGVDQPPSDDFVHLLHRETGGNPFFLEETLKAMVQARVLYRQDGGWRRRPTAALGVPPSVREAIQSRLNRLSPQERRLLEVTAVYGVHIPLETLRALADLEELTLLDTLEHMLRIQIFAEEAAPAGPVYKFCHHKIQEAIYSELSAARRQRLHGYVATRLETLYGASVDAHADELALHFGLAGQPEQMARSITYDIQAGDRAASLFAYPRAASLYLRALLHDEQAGGILGPAALFELLDNLGATYEKVGDFTAAAEFWDQALRLSDAGAGPERMAALHRNLARVHWEHGDHARALAYCRQGLAVLPDAHPVVADLHHELFEALLRQGFFGEAEAAARAEMEAASRCGDPRAEAQAQADLAAAALWLGDPETCATIGTPALNGLPAAPRIRLLQNLGWAHLRAGREAAARFQVEQALALTHRYGLTAMRALPLSLLALLDLEAGDLGSALTAAMQSVSLRREYKSPNLAPALGLLAVIQAAAGEGEVAEASCSEAEALADRLYLAEPSYLGMLTRCAAARSRLLRSDLEGARVQYQHAAELDRLGHGALLGVPQIGLVHFGETLALLGEREQAAAWLHRVAAACVKLPGSPVWASIRQVEGLIAASAGRQGRMRRGRSGERSRRPDGLSARELEIVRQVCQHKSDKEIAATLIISVRTVTTHLANIYNKLDMRSRTQLVQYGLEQGLDKR